MALSFTQTSALVEHLAQRLLFVFPAGDEDTFDGPSSVEAEANSSDGGFDDLEMPDPQELSNTGGNSNDEDRQVRSGFGWTGNVKKTFALP